MKEVTKLKNISVDHQTVNQLKELLSLAESGELKSIIFIDEHKDGRVGHGWAGQPNIRMIGEMENVKFNFFSMMYFPVEDS